MSDVMLHGVLNMPPECWSNGPLDVAQRHSRYVEASYRIQQLERELAEALEWKRYLSSWGGTPEIVYSFIQGQQARISAAQKVEKQRDLLIEGLEKLASCDWVITLPDRMDAVREIARQTLQIVKNNEL